MENNELKEQKQINFLVDYDFYEKLQKIADDNERNLSAQIRFMLQKYIEILEQK